MSMGRCVATLALAAPLVQRQQNHAGRHRDRTCAAIKHFRLLSVLGH